MRIIKQLQAQMLDYHGERFGSDGVEISAHAISAPDHLPVQGRQFSNEEFYKLQTGHDFEDVKGNEYKGFPRPIGQWNCRHVRFPIVIGISEPVHSEEQLQEFAENSKQKYDLTQQQRAMETKLRQLKTERLAASAAGDELEAKRIQKKINAQQTIYRNFSNKHNLLYDTQRASVEGYRRISIKDLQNLENRDILKKKIAKGDLSLEINIDKQKPHLLEYRDINKNKSYFTLSIEKLQELLNSNYATGYMIVSKSGQMKEIIFVDKFIGFDVDESGVAVKTNGFKVHYSKGRTHLVPYRKRLDENETI